MSYIMDTFKDRRQEISIHLILLESIDNSIKNASSYIGKDKYNILPDNQKILYSCLYIQLYNLVECTITTFIDEIMQLTKEVAPTDLSIELQKYWVRSVGKTHENLTPENRLKCTLKIFNGLNSKDYYPEWSIAKGGGGNWDRNELQNIIKLIGIKLKVPKKIYEKISKPIKLDKDPLALIVHFRNKLAHGSIAFVECGNSTTFNELKEISDTICAYLESLVNTFDDYLSKQKYMMQHD